MIRLAIDAENFLQDRRGMGRFSRPIVRAAIDDPGFKVTLLARRRNAHALRVEFGEQVLVREPKFAAEPKVFDIVWYPFNAMRYPCAAQSMVTIYDAFAFTDPARGLWARLREQKPIRRAVRNATRITSRRFCASLPNASPSFTPRLTRFSSRQPATCCHPICKTSASCFS
jgi:hypothetical protein